MINSLISVIGSDFQYPIGGLHFPNWAAMLPDPITSLLNWGLPSFGAPLWSTGAARRYIIK